MKIERINDNQIRCTLNSFDLSVRNLNLVELAYGTEKARKLFREMIQKASNEVGFEAEDIPLMVEAIPLSSESIMLVITKIEDPEELDTRFSKFAPSPEDTGEAELSQLASQYLEGADTAADAPVHEDVKNGAKGGKPAKDVRIFLFDSLDKVCEAARAVGSLYTGVNTLYKKPETRQYYLVIHREGCQDLDFSRSCNILAEYGQKQPAEYAMEAYFKEHYEIIIKEKALQDLQKI